MGAITYLYGFIAYFTFLILLASLVSLGGGFSSNNFLTTSQDNFFQQNSNINRSIDESDVSIVSGFRWKTFFADIFSFLVWDISINSDDEILSQYFWIIRILIVWIPLAYLILAIYFSLPTVSGGE